ncbi:flavin monoamine oxidase family protein [Mucilaginibacter defluvii]|uniref:FAD-dependent oxidoreductase n=1 Tax=Mucilaginibacter defluvii TaxID=1196019 RepID=A0ABP9G1F1_9SPHI
MNVEDKIIIIGGGLSGLLLAYQLEKLNVRSLFLEASNRLGGRIQTLTGVHGTPLELGATWFSDMHPNLLALIGDLGLTKFPQYSKGVSLFQTKSFEPAQQFYVSGAETPSYRLSGGTQQLIDTLAVRLKSTEIILNANADRITEAGTHVDVMTSEGQTYKGLVAVVCLPPQLAASQIKFEPILPDAVNKVLPAVQTWMAGSVKFTLEYGEPFWRNKGFSGMLYSHAGVVVEMYDHTNIEETLFGFTGFLNGGAANYDLEVRKEFVLRQLTDLFGAEAASPLTYQDKVWNDKYLLSGNPIIERPHQFNGHHLLQQAYLNQKLLFCGTETSPICGGYMEGAVISATRVAEQIRTFLNHTPHRA